MTYEQALQELETICGSTYCCHMVAYHGRYSWPNKGHANTDYYAFIWRDDRDDPPKIEGSSFEDLIAKIRRYVAEPVTTKCHPEAAEWAEV